MVVDIANDLIGVGVFCMRCRRPFLNGERVRLSFSGPAVPLRKEFDGGAGIRVADVNQMAEHENPDHCTRPR